MLVGDIATVGKTRIAIAANTKWASTFTMPAANQVAKLSLFADTLGASGSVRARGVIYDDLSGALIAAGDDIVIPQGLAADWIDLPFVDGTPGGATVDAGEVRFGINVGDSGLMVYEGSTVYSEPSFYGSATYGGSFYGGVPSGLQNSDAFVGGPSDPFGAFTEVADLAIYGSTFGLWTPPRDVEMLYGRLPWFESQVVFSATGPRSLTATPGTVAWHGTRLDPERGAFAVAQTGGKFDPMLGERLRIETRGVLNKRAVYVFVHNLKDELVTDLSLPRRPWAGLNFLGLDEMTCTVTVMS